MSLKDNEKKGEGHPFKKKLGGTSRPLSLCLTTDREGSFQIFEKDGDHSFGREKKHHHPEKEEGQGMLGITLRVEVSARKAICYEKKTIKKTPFIEAGKP